MSPEQALPRAEREMLNAWLANADLIPLAPTIRRLLFVLTAAEETETELRDALEAIENIASLQPNVSNLHDIQVIARAARQRKRE